MSHKDTSTDNVSCGECGRRFPDVRAKNIHQSRGCDTKPYHDSDRLASLYHDEGLSAAEIADQCSVTPTTIYNYLRDHGIPLKDKRTDPTRPPHHRFKPRPERGVGSEYEEVMASVDGQTFSVKIHRLVAVADGTLDPSDMWNPDVIVHHKSGHGLDNRPENLQPMPKGDHRGVHSTSR